MAKDGRANKGQSRPEPFEQLYAELEEKVGRLEQGGLSLDDAIMLYEEGMTLARECQKRLDAAEQRVTELRQSFEPVSRATSALEEPAGDYEYVNEDDPQAEEQEEFP